MPRRLLRLLALLAFQAALFLVLLELAGRLVDPLGISYYPETARYLDTLVRSEPLGYANRPGLVGKFYGVEVKINSIGLRDREVEARAADEFRVMFLGDSVPFGIGVAQDEIISVRLEQLLDATLGRERRARVINMGVPSYNTEQERIQLQTTGLSLDPQLVTLIFNPNDIEPKLWVFEKRESWWVDLANRSYAACLLYTVARRVQTRISGPPPFFTARYRADNPEWQAQAEEFRRIARLCRERTLPFVVFTFTDPDSPQVRLVRGIGADESFPVLTIPSEILAAHPNSAVDSHPDAEGSALIARFIHDRLLELGYLAP